MSGKKYSLSEIRTWLQSLNSPAHTVNGVLRYHLSEASIDRANGYIPNTHVEDENRFEIGSKGVPHIPGGGFIDGDDPVQLTNEVRSPALTEEGLEHSNENEGWGEYQGKPEDQSPIRY